MMKHVDEAFEVAERIPHQWRLSVELRSVKLTHYQAKIFVKYFYPFVQQLKPFRTNPPTFCRKNSMTYFYSFFLFSIVFLSFVEKTLHRPDSQWIAKRTLATS